MHDIRFRTRALALAGVLGCLATPAVQAESPSPFRLSGYGTLGYVQDNRHDIVAIRDISQRPDANLGYGSWERDTRLGLQAEYHLNPSVDLVGQVVFRDQVSTLVSNSIELAYIGLKPTSQMDVRIGRVGYDAFLMSDTRNIGYAYPWVRPFTEYYGWVPMFSVDGADVAYLIPQGDAHIRLKLQTGRSGTSLPIGNSKIDFRSNDVLNLTASRRSGPLEVKLGLSSFSSRREVAPDNAGGGLSALQQGLRDIAAATAVAAPAISSEADDLHRQISFKGARINYLTLGASYDHGPWLIQGELAKTSSNHKIVPHGTMGYAVVAYRLGDWTPFVAYSASRPGNSLRTAANDWSVIGQAATQATAIASLNSTRMDQSTVSLGARWDFGDRAALKLQWDSTRVSPQGYGLLFKDPVLETRSSRMGQLTLTLDFLF